MELLERQADFEKEGTYAFRLCFSLTTKPPSSWTLYRRNRNLLWVTSLGNVKSVDGSVFSRNCTYLRGNP